MPPPPAVPTPVEPVRATAATVNAELDAEEEFDADDDLDPDEGPSARPTLRDMLRRISPAIAALTVGSVGSALFLVRAMTSHTTPVGVLMSAGVVTALVFALDTVILSAATYSTSKTEAAGWALLFALLGGISAVICALALAGSLIMILVLNS